MRVLDRLAFGIERLELGGDAARLDLVVGGEQPGAEARSADPAAGIDARAQDEAERVAGRRFVDAGGVGERAQALIVPGRNTLSPLATKARFASLSGTTSHTVASATRSSRPSRSGSGVPR